MNKIKLTFTFRLCRILLLAVMALSVCQGVPAREKAKTPIMRSKSTSISTDYQQVGNTMLYCRQGSDIDFQGYYEGYYYGSTYSNRGYRVAVQVNGGTASSVDCLGGSNIDGVQFSANVEQQGELARVCYVLTNTLGEDVTVSVGTHADVMIGSNDRAPIERRKDLADATYGLTMKDGNGAQLCVLFGAGLAGVSKVDDFWFGPYSLNSGYDQMVGNYSSEGNSNYMMENGSYDSGMGWCWKNRPIAAGETLVLSYLIGVGDVRLEPNSSFEVTPDDPEGWNDLSRPHRLTLSGTYESPAGIDGIIEYAVEDSEEWMELTDTLASGEEFTAELVAQFNPERENHTINFRIVDAVGNTTQLVPIIYKDVYYHEIAGIENKTYHYGDSVYQTNITCDLAADQYVVNGYQNNVNAGTATFMVQGVFPQTIGRRTYSFEISPLALEGGINLAEYNFVYSGETKFPEWQFTSELNNNLVEGVDYTVAYTNNIYPGEGTVEVKGINNFTGTLSGQFLIDKAQLYSSLYEFTLPAADILYDGESHAASVYKAEGVGDVAITYVNTYSDTASDLAPTETGRYDVYVEFADGPLYYGMANEKIGTFEIYEFYDWGSLQSLDYQLQQCGWYTGWDMVTGPAAVGQFEGLTIKQGRVVAVDFSYRGLTEIPEALLGFSGLSSVNLSHNNLTGNAAAVFSQMYGLTELNLSYNRLSEVQPMFPNNMPLALDISHQEMDNIVNLNLSEFKKEDIATTIPSILLYDHDAQAYCRPLRLMCTTAASENVGPEDWAIEMHMASDTILIYSLSQDNAYRGLPGDILKVFDMDNGSSFSIMLDFDSGDANFVGGIDAADLMATILYAFGSYTYEAFNFTAADTYADGYINVQDVVCTVNILLNRTDTGLYAKRMAPGGKATDAEAAIYMQDGNIILRSDKPVAAVSVKAGGKVEWHMDRYGMVQTVAGGSAVGYSLAGATLPVGETVIGTYTGNARIEYASLADSEAHGISVALGNTGTTGITTVTGPTDGTDGIYDASGRKAERLGKGVNIIRKGNRTVKVVNGKNK